MLRKPLCLLILLPLLTCCAGEARNAQQFIGIPVPTWSAEDQKATADKITAKCGSPPACPQDAVLERAALDYVKLRAEAKAANKAAP